MSKTSQWISGINAVASALEHDIEHVREVLVEAGSKNARIVEIEENARRRDISVRRVTHQALEGIAGGLRHQGVIARYEAAKPTEESELPGLIEAAAGKGDARRALEEGGEAETVAVAGGRAAHAATAISGGSSGRALHAGARRCGPCRGRRIAPAPATR